ncbi:MAG TPA: hypothetical protein VHI78_11300 [Bacteroidales bacterium]|jgi:hypothetical protein|nr:hypothetical protein [Bacteroidales bacterium]
MNLVNNFKSLVGERMLLNQQRNQSRLPSFHTLNEASNIGIIYNATEYISFEIIKNLVKDLSRDSKKITVLGYVDSKNLIDNYLYRKGFDFFSRNDLNWYFKPVSGVVEEFIKEPFDLLINLSLDDHFPIRYITSVSSATFKAGRFSPHDNCLDLMIDIEKERQDMRKIQEEVEKQLNGKIGNREIEAGIERKTETEILLNFLINQLLHYLSILKK